MNTDSDPDPPVSSSTETISRITSVDEETVLRDSFLDTDLLHPEPIDQTSGQVTIIKQSEVEIQSLAITPEDEKLLISTVKEICIEQHQQQRYQIGSNEYSPTNAGASELCLPDLNQDGLFVRYSDDDQKQIYYSARVIYYLENRDWIPVGLYSEFTGFDRKLVNFNNKLKSQRCFLTIDPSMTTNVYLLLVHYLKQQDQLDGFIVVGGYETYSQAELVISLILDNDLNHQFLPVKFFPWRSHSSELQSFHIHRLSLRKETSFKLLNLKDASISFHDHIDQPINLPVCNNSRKPVISKKLIDI